MHVYVNDFYHGLDVWRVTCVSRVHKLRHTILPIAYDVTCSGLLSYNINTQKGEWQYYISTSRIYTKNDWPRLGLILKVI